jgi:predicted transposase/invertase (TIGR01784 family)
MTSRFLDPKNDIAFKKVFGTEQNKDILIHFLNDVLGFKGKHAIKTVEFLQTVQDPEIAEKKQSIVDILCQDALGVKYIIEMQVTKTKGFEKRAQYYAAKAYCQQADQGSQYQDLKEVIFIAIADCIIFPEKTNYISRHILLDPETHEHDLKDFSFTFIELPKFKKEKPEELKTFLEKWCYFFKYAGRTGSEEFLKIIGKDRVIRKAYKMLNRYYWDEQELYRYEREQRRIRDEMAILEQRLDDATEKGREEMKRYFVQKLMASGMSMEQITELLAHSDEISSVETT